MSKFVIVLLLAIVGLIVLAVFQSGRIRKQDAELQFWHKWLNAGGVLIAPTHKQGLAAAYAVGEKCDTEFIVAIRANYTDTLSSDIILPRKAIGTYFFGPTVITMGNHHIDFTKTDTHELIGKPKD